MEFIKNPSEEILQIINAHNPKSAYQKIALQYGGKAAGLLVSSVILQDEPSLSTLQMPFGIAISEREIKEGKAGELYDSLKREGIEKVLLRSSAAAEDSFEDRWAGLAESRVLRVTTKEAFIEGFTEYYEDFVEQVEWALKTECHVVVNELCSVDGVHVVHSNSDLHRNASRISSYASIRGLIRLEPRDPNHTLAEVVSLVDRREGVVRSAVALPTILERGGMAQTYFFGAGNPREEREAALIEWFALQSVLDTLNHGACLEETIARFVSSDMYPIFGAGPHTDSNLLDSEEALSTFRKTEKLRQTVTAAYSVGRILEERCGYPVDLEIGLHDGGLLLFQSRPFIRTQLKPRKRIPSSVDVVFAAQVVSQEFTYWGPLYTFDTATDSDMERVTRVPTPRLSFTDKYAPAAAGTAKYENSAIYLGDKRVDSFSWIDGHGGGGVTETYKGKAFNNRLIYPFVRAFGERTSTEDYVTPFNVQLISDGSFGLMYLRGRDVDLFRKLSSQKLKELESKLGW